MRQYITGLGAFIKMDIWTDAAITYWSLGYNPIPCGIESKRSICEWSEYQDRRISYEEILNYGKYNPLANVAIITGEISYLVVVDVDGPEGQEFLIQLKGFPAYLPTVRTGRGYHYYFRYPDFEVPTMRDTELKIEIRSNGAYVMAPPSIHPDGGQYQWEHPHQYEWPSYDDLPELPRSLIKHFETRGKISKSGEKTSLKNIESSKRDWKRAKKEIKKHSGIIEWLKTPKPDDRSGHDWSLVMLCLEHGLSEEALLYQILLHNEHGKANSRKNDQEKYVTKLIYQAKSEYKQPALFISAHALSKMEFSESHSIIGKGVLSPGMGLILAGEGEVGKSVAISELALRLVSGEPFLGLTTAKINGVLIVQSENILPMIQDRLKKQQLGLKLSKLPDNVFFSEPKDSYNLTNKKDRSQIIEMIKSTESEVVIFDPFIAFHHADENDNSKMRKVLGYFDRIKHETGAAIILVHHFSKTTERSGKYRLRGASTIYDWADTVIELSGRQNSSERTIKFLKLRNGPLHPDIYVKRDGNLVYQVVDEKSKCPPGKVVEVLKNDFGGHCKQKGLLVEKICQQVDCSESTAKKAIDKASNKELIKITKIGRSIKIQVRK